MWYRQVFVSVMLVMILCLATACQPVGVPGSQGGATSAGSAAAAEPAAGGVLTVWHGWQDAELSILEETSTHYQANTGTTIELVQLDAPILLEKLLAATVAGNAPDIVLGSHAWGDTLLQQGFAAAYCLPGGCPECESQNPLHWCQFALGDFSHGRNDDFLINGRCIDGPCPECRRPSPPRWCYLATIDLEPKLDVFQSAFTQWIDEINRPFPLGIPIWWDYGGLFINSQWFADQGLPPPTQATEVIELMKGLGRVYYDPDALAQFNLPEELTVALPQDPVPFQEAAILLMSSAQFTQLRNEMKALTPLPLADYQPTVWVEGAYMNAATQQPSQALAFMYALADEEAQRLFFANTGHLPVHSAVLAENSDNMTATLVEIGKTGLPFAPTPGLASASEK